MVPGCNWRTPVLPLKENDSARDSSAASGRCLAAERLIPMAADRE